MQYNSLNVKLSNSQLNKLKNKTEVVLILSSNMVGDDETNFPHKLLLTNRQVANMREAFANYLSADINLSKTQLSKMTQLVGFLGSLLGLLLKTGLPLMKNVIKPLAKSVLIPSGVTAAAATDAGMHKRILGYDRPLSSALPYGHSWHNNTILIISNDEIKDIVEIGKSLEDSSLLFKRVSEKIQNKAKEQKGF